MKVNNSSQKSKKCYSKDLSNNYNYYTKKKKVLIKMKKKNLKYC